jgi:hypothetical protein
MEESIELIHFIEGIGVPGLMALIIFGGLKGWWVFGWIYVDMRNDRNEWRSRALQTVNVAEKLVEQNGHGKD